MSLKIFQKINQKKGFTLTEIVITVAIIAVLATVVFFRSSDYRIKSRDTKRIHDIKEIQFALELYKRDTGSYPESLDFGEPLVNPLDPSTEYFKNVPQNPKPRNDGDCPDEEYQYFYDSEKKTYFLNFCLAFENNEYGFGPLTARPSGVEVGQKIEIDQKETEEEIPESTFDPAALAEDIFNEYKARVLSAGGEINNESKTYAMIENLVDKNLHENILLHLSSNSGLIKPKEVTFAYKQDWNSWPNYSTLYMTRNSIVNGILNVTSSSHPDPMIFMNSLGSFNPNIYKYIELRYRIISGAIGKTQIYFLNSRRTSANEDQRVDSPVMIPDGDWRVLRIYMGGHQYWTHSNITGWRYDWSTVANTTMEFDYIGLTDGREGMTAFNLSTNEKNAIQEIDYHLPEITNEGISFNASNQWLKIPAVTDSNSFTLALWIKFKSLTPNDSAAGERIISQRGPLSADYDWHILREPISTSDNRGNMWFTVKNEAGTGFSNNFGSVKQDPPLNEWIFLTAVVDAEKGELRTYVNGSDEIKRTNLTGKISTLAEHIVIGRKGWGDLTGGTTFGTPNATMNDIQIYSKALTASEVQDLYNSTKGDYGL